jgi:hypothetical protein
MNKPSAYLISLSLLILEDLKSVPTSKKKHRVSVTKTNQFMLFIVRKKETHKYIVGTKCRVFFMVKQTVRIIHQFTSAD